MISVNRVNECLMGNFDAIMEILDNIGLTNIHPNYAKGEIRCSREEGRNPSSVVLNVNRLNYFCFSTGGKGNIYTLIMSKTGKNFPSALSWVAETLCLQGVSDSKLSVKLPFDGFYKKIIKQQIEPELSLTQYDTSILNEYRGKYSLMFAKDGIGYDTQEFFDVGYDIFTNRITVPQWDMYGNLVGIMGRLNQTEASDEPKWYPIIPCRRGLLLYGFHNNYESIQQKGYCLIGESEKFVMQLKSMGFRNALALGGCNISNAQSRELKSLMCKRLILCLDEGLEEEQIREQANKIKIANPLLKNKVGYIYDSSGEILKKGTKNAPSDLGKNALKTLVREKTIWL